VFQDLMKTRLFMNNVCSGPLLSSPAQRTQL
jgi:hypothetical protein